MRAVKAKQTHRAITRFELRNIKKFMSITAIQNKINSLYNLRIDELENSIALPFRAKKI